MSDRYVEHSRRKLADTQNYRDDHHLCFSANEWNARPQGEHIRRSMVARGMGRVAHNVLHKAVPGVPVPMVYTLQRVAADLKPGQDIFRTIDQYCSIVEANAKHPKIKPIEIDLNELSIEAIRMQIPYLRDGMRRSR